ncbi:MAG: N-acetylneuraminic acid synthase NeuB family protein [Verrucomicrobiales bacterium]|jgi:N,N'-diacetyllegionaminate synthase|nr:N-acetylneuraminic acid synthase NeuB family protein [Verrucomicrobiales bacterium]
MQTFSIGDRKIGAGQPCFIIGEVAQAHDGSLNFAHSFIDSVANAGADAVKFQTHIAAAESSPDEQWRVRFSKQDDSRFDYWKRMEFTPEQWRGLKEHADSRGLGFLSSPFSLAAVELLSNIGIQVWKIASGEVRNSMLLDKIIATKLPVLLSSGMSSWKELEETVALLKQNEIPFLLMQCTSAYPCPPERIGLNLLNEMKDRFGCETGLSDHSGMIYPALAAATLGAKVVELHVTWDRTMFGPDAVASVTFAELKELVKAIRYTETMLTHPVNKEIEASNLEAMRKMFGQSLVAAKNLPAGVTLTAADLTSKKPQIGIPVAQYRNVLGSKTKRIITEGEFLQFTDIQK